jgi:hypothetical protein
VLALRRRRSLFLAIAVVTALSGATGHALAWTHGDCLGTGSGDQHCAAALPWLPVALLTTDVGVLRTSDPGLTPRIVVYCILKIPLVA